MSSGWRRAAAGGGRRARGVRRRGRARDWLWLSLCLLALLAPRLAAAAQPYGVVTVDLRPEIGEVPTHLCVVSQGQGPRTRESLRSIVAANPSGSPGDDEWLVDPVTWGGGADDTVCAAEGICVPRVELPALTGERPLDGLYVACTGDSLMADRGPEDPRLLVMMLEHLEGSPPLLESIQLTGGIATIGVQADLARIVVTARSLGGHYAAHGRAFRAEARADADKLVVLPLAPRCHGVEVELPGLRLRESDRGRLTIEAEGVSLDADSCVGPLRGSSRMRVELPRAVGSGRLLVELPPAKDERPTATRFAAGWDRAWPEGELVLAPTRIAFVWSPPACVWNHGSCPRATLEGGIACQATPLDAELGGACQYVCPGDDDGGEPVELAPPVGVTFERDEPRQVWTEILQRPGQTLSSYVPRDQIYLHADTSGWRTKVPGSRISHVELLGDDGGVRRYAVDGVDELRVLAPGASCDPLRYRLVGDRRYVEGSAPVRDGEIEFGDVHQSARLLTFNIMLAPGGGFTVGYGGIPEQVVAPINFAAVGHLAAKLRPRSPRFARVAYELRVAGTIGQWGYFGAGSIGNDPRRVTSKVGWARLLGEFGVVVDVVSPLAVGVGLGIGRSWPVSIRQEANTGSFDVVISPSVDLRFDVRNWLTLVVQGRAVLLERSLVATDIIGDLAVVQGFPAITLLGGLGVLFGF